MKTSGDTAVHKTHGILAFAAGAIVIGGVTFLASLLYHQPLTSWWLLVWPLVGIGVLAVALAVGWILKKVAVPRTAATLAVAAAIIGLGGAITRIAFEAADPRLEDAVVCLTTGESYPGLLIGEASNSVYLGQRLEDAPDVVVSITKERVEEVWIGRGVSTDHCLRQPEDRPH